MRRLQAFHRGLSPESIRLRFHGCLKELPDGMAHRFCEVDGTDRVAFVAVTGDPEEIIGVGRYDRQAEAEAEAEVAFVVADRYHQQGIGWALLQRLLDAARRRGIRRMVARVLPGNTPMRRLLERTGYPIEITWAGDHNQVWMTLPDA